MPRTSHIEIRSEIIQACLQMNALGINQGTSGNVSVRVGKGFLITPSGVPYDALVPDGIVRMDMLGQWTGTGAPSSEWQFHRDILKKRQDAGAIIHAHAPFCTTLACLRRDIPAFHYMIAVAGGVDIRCAPYATFGTQELSDNALSALEGRKACLLANHGVIVIEHDLPKAFALAVEVETLAMQYWRALTAGEPFLLSETEMQRVLERFKSYGRPGSGPDMGKN